MTTTPHDALFKAAFSKLRHARALLPPALARQITWSTLRLESGIAVGDDALDEQRMDLVFSARAGRRRVLLYVLVLAGRSPVSTRAAAKRARVWGVAPSKQG